MSNAQALSRTQIFQNLKPLCLTLGSLSFTSDVSKSQHEIQLALKNLAQQVATIAITDRNHARAIGEYVFYPLGFLLKQSQNLNDETLCNVLWCLRELTEHVWRFSIPVELFQQLLILFNSLLEGTKLRKSSVRLKRESCLCLLSLLNAGAEQDSAFKEKASQGRSKLVFAHGVTVLLEYISNADTAEQQMTALEALSAALSRVVQDADCLASMLPGVFSSLCKGLQRDAYIRYYVNVNISLRIIQHIITDTMSNVLVDRLGETEPASNDPTTFVRTRKWAQATKSQIKMGLESIIFLRSSDQSHSRHAMLRLLVNLFKSCCNSLDNINVLAVETILLGTLDEFESIKVDALQAVRDLAGDTRYNRLVLDCLSESLQDLSTRLDRVLTSHDESPKQELFALVSIIISIGREYFPEHQLDCDQVFLKLQELVEVSDIAVSAPSPGSAALVSSDLLVGKEQSFTDVALTTISSGKTKSLLRELLGLMAGTDIARRISAFMDDQQTVNDTITMDKFHWISIQLLQNSGPGNSLDTTMLRLNDQLYSRALATLRAANDDDKVVPTSSLSLSLQSIAQSAQISGKDFRYELFDCLYPVIQVLAHSDSSLRENAQWCLHQVAFSCGYADLQEMLLENLDYLVNAISLKLNTFDISPSGPITLVVLLRLAGAQVVPYMHDLIDSIFTALDTFQIYPKLIVALFQVLDTVVEQVAEVRPRPAIEPAEPTSTRLDAVLENLKKRKDKGRAVDEKYAKPRSETESESNMEQDKKAQDVEKPKLEPSMNVVSEIMTKAQMFLTHESSQLKYRLLVITARSAIILSREENTLLPLINQLWPLVVNRLSDPEIGVVEAACTAIAEFCCSARDFMSARIEEEGWPALKKVFPSRPFLKSNAVSRRNEWSRDSKLKSIIYLCLASVLKSTRLNLRTYDDILDTLAPDLRNQSAPIHGQQEILSALRQVHADATWLVIDRQRDSGKGRM